MAKTFGDIVRETRKRKGLTQMNLVELGQGRFSLATLKNLEGGRANPRLGIILAIVSALGGKLWVDENAVTERTTGS